MKLDSALPSPTLWHLAKRTVPYIRGQLGAIRSVVALAVLGAALAALEPWLLKQLFDGFVSAEPTRAPWRALGLLAAMLIGCDLLSARLDCSMWKVRLAIDFALMRAAIDRLHSLPLSYHREQSVGATMTKVERGIAGSMAALSDLVVRLLPSIMYLGVSIAVMLRLEWRLALAVMMLAPLPAWLGARAAREQTAREQGLLERWTHLFARFNEVLSGIVVVKSFVMEDREKRRFLDGVGEANALVLEGVSTDAKTNLGKSLLTVSARLFALGTGGVLVMKHEITLGTLVAFIGYLGGVFHPVQAMTNMYQTLRRASVSLSAVLSVLEAEDSLGDWPDARDVDSLRGDVEFRQVAFRYRPERPIFDDVSLTVRAGETIALVGPSGAGKTTLISLLQRLYDPERGAILIDGSDIRTFKQRSLRSKIAVVLQEGSLFSDSVRDNIAFGRPDASALEIEHAARAANAHDFIMALPQGYETPVGERGCKLSVGEKQRIAIARAILKDAPILILDEATSALDVESESKVQDALARLTLGRTAFVIAHRLATIVGADRIAVVRDGGIVEVGSHEELMRQGGYYATVLRTQLEGLSASAA
ncbi:MAG TPA: ABC transporter ATP-binding protein [Polyangiales bacterium]|jgi:ATP-binding cassette subfamily B protein|nr:ABC transporter ATP-binding protein [Polyangiales bacterium]